MIKFACLLVVCAAAGPAQGPDFHAPDFHQRRQALRNRVHGVIVLSGKGESLEDIYSARARFFPDPNFFYLTGWREPGAKLLLDSRREILFLPPHDADREKWTEGNVVSVEPGLYIPDEQIGIRIEDMVLVTRDGAQVLTAALPKEAAEIERRMAR